MLRRSRQPWWRRFFAETLVPAYILERPAIARRCPECGFGYGVRDRYCPSCHVATPEWRFG